MIALPACSPVGPDFVKPTPEAPAQWTGELDAGLRATPAELGNWWASLQDPVLNALVEEALKHNNSLQIAGLRILEARAQLGIAIGSQYPQYQAASGQATWISPPDNTGVTSTYWQYSLGAAASWEIDFWGRFQRAVESADAAFLASVASYRQAEVVLVNAVVDTYAVVRITEEKLRIAHDNVRIQQRSFEIAEVLFRNGQDSELDMQQARTLLLATEATIPSLEASLAQARNALSTLLGEPTGGVEPRLSVGSGIPLLPGQLPIGLPADLLRNRPDVREAELLAMAQNARVGLAEADLYPSFSLSGAIGLSAGAPGNSDFGDLFDTDALSVTLGPSFVWPFLNYGRIRNNVRVQDARLQQALVAYRETVLQAAREAEDAMAAYIGARRQAEILAKTVESAQRSNELSTLRYQEGFSDYQRVLDAQQALFTQQQRLADTQGAGIRSLVGLYKSLGAGWQASGDRPFVDPETLEAMQQRTNWGALINAAYPDRADAPTGE
jgi:NodT family efflux transporter outer membrane factor (OMF) lipoprotein